jgi:hypothetical protein
LIETFMNVHKLRSKEPEEYGTGLAEIEEVVRNGSAIPTRYGRMAKAKVFESSAERKGVYYEQKRVEVYYLPGAAKSPFPRASDARL